MTDLISTQYPNIETPSMPAKVPRMVFSMLAQIYKIGVYPDPLIEMKGTHIPDIGDARPSMYVYQQPRLRNQRSAPGGRRGSRRAPGAAAAGAASGCVMERAAGGLRAMAEGDARAAGGARGDGGGGRRSPAQPAAAAAPL